MDGDIPDTGAQRFVAGDTGVAATGFALMMETGEDAMTAMIEMVTETATIEMMVVATIGIKEGRLKKVKSPGFSLRTFRMCFLFPDRLG